MEASREGPFLGGIPPDECFLGMAWFMIGLALLVGKGFFFLGMAMSRGSCEETEGGAFRLGMLHESKFELGLPPSMVCVFYRRKERKKESTMRKRVEEESRRSRAFHCHSPRIESNPTRNQNHQTTPNESNQESKNSPVVQGAHGAIAVWD